MKISQVCIRYYPALGGVEEYVKRISEYQADNGDDVRVYTSNLKYHFSNQTIEDGPSVYNGVKIYRYPILPVRFKKYSVSLELFSKLVKDDADIIHAHSYMYFSADAAGIISRINKKPMVFNPYISELGPPSILGVFYRNTFGKLLMSSDVVVIISDYEKKVISDWGYTPKRYEKVPPGVDTEEIKNVKRNIFKERGIKGKVILYAGRLDNNKGVDVLVKAYKLIQEKNRDLNLVIAGPDFGSLEDLKKLAGMLGVREKVAFLNDLNREELLSAYKNSHIFAFPTRYEAFGIVMIEAIACGLPVVATRCSAVPYVLNENSEALMFKKDDHAELAKKIIEIDENNGLRNNLVKNGQKRVNDDYIWDKSLKKMEGIYKSLIKKNK